MRARLREFVLERLDQTDEFSIDELVAAAHETFTGDAEFAEAARASVIDLVLPAIIQSATREGRRRTSWGAVSNARAVSARARMAGIFESHEGRYHSLLAMRRPEIRGVIEQRKAQVAGELRWIKALQACEAALPDDRTLLGSLPEQRLDRIWHDHFEPGNQ